jgi:hypothetical protein
MGKDGFDLALFSRLFFVLILAVIIGSVFYQAIGGQKEDAEKAAEQMSAIISKAAVQCYALEGSYPSDVYYLAKYGVIFDDERFYYIYSNNFISNYMPEINVLTKE